MKQMHNTYKASGCQEKKVFINEEISFFSSALYQKRTI